MNKKHANNKTIAPKISNTTLSVAALALLGFSGIAGASELVLYRSFAEVRENVKLSGNRFEWSPGNDLANFLVPGSLALEYPGVLSQILMPGHQSLLHAFEGKEVMLRQNGQLVKARVVRADLNLFEVNGQFMQVDPASVVYPNLDGVRFAPTYSFALSGAGGESTLSYLTRGVGWNPRYNLGVTNDKAKLESWADVTNQTNVEWKAPGLTLVAGDVQIIGSGPEYGPMAADAAQGAPNQYAKAQNVQSTGESAGLQLFEYKAPIQLSPRSSNSLRFLEGEVKLEKTLIFETGFSEAPRFVLPLSREYGFKAGSDLPRGQITVREDGRVVGQASMQDTPKGEDVRFTLGADFDLRLTRTLQTLERTTKNAKFKVGLSLVNTKKRAVNIRLREYMGGQWSFEQAVLPNLKKEVDGYVASATLQPGARLEGSYTVSFKYQ